MKPKIVGSVSNINEISINPSLGSGAILSIGHNICSRGELEFHLDRSQVIEIISLLIETLDE